VRAIWAGEIDRPEGFRQMEALRGELITVSAPSHGTGPGDPHGGTAPEAPGDRMWQARPGFGGAGMTPMGAIQAPTRGRGGSSEGGWGGARASSLGCAFTMRWWRGGDPIGLLIPGPSPSNVHAVELMLGEPSLSVSRPLVGRGSGIHAREGWVPFHFRDLNKKAFLRVRVSALIERTDGELVAASLRGDSGAFGLLVKRYMRSGYLVALSVTGNAEDAEDVAQESFLVALERLEDCRDRERFGGWFLTIVRNRSRNLLRRERLRRGEGLSPEIVSGSGGPDVDLKRLGAERPAGEGHGGAVGRPAGSASASRP
jgi:hypothetical protein